MSRKGQTRREFLTYGLVGSAGVAAGVLLDGQPAAAYNTTHIDHPRFFPPAAVDSVKSTCGVCFWKCGINVEIGDEGEALHISGVQDHPLSRGKLCPRGVGGIGFHEDTDRLTKPQIRTGERGEAAYRDVSWDEANSEMGQRLREIIEKDGPGAVAFLTHGAAESYFEHLAAAIGTGHHAHPAYDQCKAPREVGYKLTFGHTLKSPEPVDIENTDCLVLIGSHLGENMHNLQVQELVSADTRGTNLIVVDPRRSTAALRADIWLQIKPGTDIALLLAWTHILIRDGLYDHDFVREFASGFDQLSEHVARTTPEWAAAETGLSVEEIEASARMIGEAGPHMALHPGRHVVWYGDDTQRARAMAILVAISGSWGARGGYYLPQKAHLPSIEEVYPEMPEFPPLAERRDPGYPFAVGVNVNGIRQATLDGAIKAWVVVGTNLVTSLPAQHETIEAMKKLEFLAVVDVLPTEVTRYADVLLPAASYIERTDNLVVTQSRDPFVAISQKAVEPVGDSRAEAQIARDIGAELGLERYWLWDSVEELNKATIDKMNADDEGDGTVDWDELVREGFVVLNEGRPIYREGQGLGADGSDRAGATLNFPPFRGDEGDGKVQLYSPDLEKLWLEKVEAGDDPTGYEPLPTYYPPLVAPPGHVRLLYGRSPVHTFGRTQNTPVLNGRESENTVWVSPATAAAYGVKDNAWVELINQDGARQGPVRLNVTNRMSDDSVYITHGYGHNSRQLTRAYKKGVDDSALMTKYAVDPLSGGTGMRVNFVRLVQPNSA
ncbi:MAG: molybdopterin-dependent oxidoreductase [Actinomycetota bacterium]